LYIKEITGKERIIFFIDDRYCFAKVIDLLKQMSQNTISY